MKLTERLKLHTLNRYLGIVIDNLISLFKIFIVCFIIVQLFVNFLFRPYVVDGDSMHPTIRNGTFLIVNSYASYTQDIKRGDIVVAYEGVYEHANIIKRVIGMPGDHIFCKNDRIYINGNELDEPYLDTEWAKTIRDTGTFFNENFSEIVLADDEYFLLGDNRINSIDSIEYGPFKRKSIKAIGAYVVLPFNKFGNQIR